jgi:deazaflavin-dependent oxidoreductase (nitroreductase family)
MAPFERLADESFAYLTTTGRVTGKAHTIEIWFAIEGGTLFMLSGGGDRADWVKNIRKDPDVRIRVGTRTVGAKARIVRAGTKEDERARQLLAAKYQGWREGRPLSGWARTSLPVAVDLTD